MQIRHLQFVTFAGCLIALIAAGRVTAQSPEQPHADRVGSLQGSVVDASGNVVLGVKVRVSSERFSAEKVVDQNGRFRFELAPGTYEITTQADVWYPVRRSEVKVSQGSTVDLTLLPRLKVSTVSSTISSTGMTEPITLRSAPEYEIFRPSDGHGAVVIEYASRTRDGDRIVFGDVVVTYGRSTVRAKSVIYFPAQTKLVAKKDVWIEDENGVGTAAKATISFRNGCMMIETS